MTEDKTVYKSPSPTGKGGFEDLDFYKLSLVILSKAHQLADTLPVHEKYDLASQIRRASKSIAANIAEGYGRYHYLDSLRFYSIARGSLNETLSHFITAKVLGYIGEEEFLPIYQMIREAEKGLNGFMGYIRRQRLGHELFGDQAVHEGETYYITGEDVNSELHDEE